MSSKGQSVIPKEMRKNFGIGEKFAIIDNGKQLILKRLKDMPRNFEEDKITFLDLYHKDHQ